MEDNPDQILKQFLADICSMKVHRSSSLGAALKKPLLLLLLVSRIENRQIVSFRQACVKWERGLG